MKMVGLRFSDSNHPWRSVWPEVAIALIVVGLVSAPAASASAPTVLKAPWVGSTDAPYKNVGVIGCAHSKISLTPQWYRSSGVARSSDTAAASQCLANASSGGAAEATLTITVPLSLASGSHHVIVHWKLAAYLHALISVPTGCTVATANGHSKNTSLCQAIADGIIEVFTYLEDTTNQSYFGATPYYVEKSAIAEDINQTYCNATRCTYYQLTSSTPTSTAWVNSTETSTMGGTFVGSHSYVLYSQIIVFSEATVLGFPSAHASAVANLGTNGHHAVLAAIFLT